MKGCAPLLVAAELALACFGSACAAPHALHQSATVQEPVPELGSLRHARAALPAPAPDRPWTYFARSMSAEELAALAREAPGVHVVSGLTREQALARAVEAHGIDGFYATSEFITRAENLAWVQAMSAGVDGYLGTAALMENEDIVLTNLQGVSGPAIADHVFGMLLTLSRQLRFYAREQEASRWTRGCSAGGSAFALQGKTLLVVGLGGIGTEIARRGDGFGMRVTATRRSDAPGPAYLARLGRSEDLLAMLPEADVVAIAVPLTAETQGLFDAAAFAAMRPGAILINIARGKVVDTAALLDALRSGQLGGACLDVTDPEPLPPDHPLWREPSVFITPHVASDAELTGERVTALLRENLRRFGAGEPLFNVVDKLAGY